MGLFRLFLATVVANDHWRATILIPNGNHAGALFYFNAGHAVLLFYAISGFLITYTLSVNYNDDWSGRIAFYRNRFVRIFSVYWPVAALSVFIVPLPPLSLMTIPQVFIIGQDWALVFGRYFGLADFAGNLVGLNQSWTLGAELAFYLIAPFLLRNVKALILVCLLSLTIRLAFVITLGEAQSHPQWTYYFFPSTVCFFLFGQLVCMASIHWPQLRTRFLAFLAPSLLVVVPGIYVVQVKIFKLQSSPFDGATLWIPMALFVISLPALFEMTKNFRVMNYLGNLSYPLYLTHILTLMVFLNLAYPSLEPYGRVISTWSYLLAAILVAAATHHILEAPTSALMQRLASALSWRKRKRAA